MKVSFGGGLAISALAAVLATSAQGADLGGYYGGSVKDVPVPEYAYAPTSNCYGRGDVGYSGSVDPTVKWPVLNPLDDDGDDVDEPEDHDGQASSAYFAGDTVTGVTMEDTWLLEGGLGCKFGSTKSIRVEATLGYRGKRNVEGEPVPYEPIDEPPVEDDPLHTAVTSYTMMLNVYKDFGTFGRITPYVGAGVGVAYHMMSSPYFTLADGTPNPHFPERIAGNNDLTLAWAVMAGIGVQVSERAVLDIGYRYIDLGEIESQGVTQSGNGAYPEVRIEDMAAHEFKVGLRYSFGGGYSGYSGK